MQQDNAEQEKNELCREHGKELLIPITDTNTDTNTNPNPNPNPNSKLRFDQTTVTKVKTRISKHTGYRNRDVKFVERVGATPRV